MERRWSFLRFVELLLAHSGGLFEAARYARACEIARPTAAAYLRVLEETFVAHVIRPHGTRRASEIVAAPKVYGFDTGFVALFKGWQTLRDEDRGQLWEHYVLNECLARIGIGRLRYWRDKRGREIDFVVTRPGRPPAAIECTWRAGDFDGRPLKAFRTWYPEGENFVVTSDTAASYVRLDRGVAARFVGLPELMQRLAAPPA